MGLCTFFFYKGQYGLSVETLVLTQITKEKTMKKKYLIPESQVVALNTTAPILVESFTPNGEKTITESTDFLAPTFSGDDSGEEW